MCINFNLLWGEQLEKAIQENKGQIHALAGAETNGINAVAAEGENANPAKLPN
jgi:hypothetical protein